MICKNCGYQNDNKNEKCASCGSSLPKNLSTENKGSGLIILSVVLTVFMAVLPFLPWVNSGGFYASLFNLAFTQYEGLEVGNLLFMAFFGVIITSLLLLVIYCILAFKRKRFCVIFSFIGSAMIIIFTLCYCLINLRSASVFVWLMLICAIANLIVTIVMALRKTA